MTLLTDVRSHVMRCLSQASVSKIVLRHFGMQLSKTINKKFSVKANGAKWITLTHFSLHDIYDAHEAEYDNIFAKLLMF